MPRTKKLPNKQNLFLDIDNGILSIDDNKVKINEKSSKVIEKKEPVKKTVYKTTSYCDRCKAQIDCEANSARLSSLTGKADWHRNCKLDRVKLCNECALELSNMIDKWLISKNKELDKWGKA